MAPVRLHLPAAVSLLQAASGGSPPRQQRPVIDPTPLREALNSLPSQEFKMGEQCCESC